VTLNNDAEPPIPEEKAPAPGDTNARARRDTDDYALNGGEKKVPAQVQEQHKTSCLDEIEPVRAYLQRIGAEARGLTTAAVTSDDGRYKADVATIRINKTTGDVTVTAAFGHDCDTSEFEPNDEERATIAAAVKAARWPELKTLMRLPSAGLPAMIGKAAPEDLFEFRQANGNIAMWQVRFELDDGGKVYVPWTYWDDGQWRKCEPDGPLPLWGQDQLKGETTAFIHEGAKAAARTREMVEAGSPDMRRKLADHPWGQELSGAAHLGWIGGAPNPHRTDWSILNRSGITRVYIVADNDRAGQKAVPKIARLLASYPITVMVIRFDERFPPSFDLADPFPDKLFRQVGAQRAYCGPTFADLLEPATWATRLIPPPSGKGKAKAVLRSEFAQQWYVVNGLAKPLFVSAADRSRLVDEQAFNTAVRPFSDTAHTSELMKSEFSSAVAGIAYEPGDEEGPITVGGARCINMWTRSRIQPARDLRPGDDQPWVNFLTYLIPLEADRLEVMRWVATLIARPRVRMKYALLLMSTVQGVGKTTLCEVLKVLVGERNFEAPSAKDVVERQFNAWIIRKRLVCVNEVYEGNGWTAYNKMKPFITDETLLANEKMKPEYPIANRAHFILCSNSTNALMMEDTDRRFLVPEVTEVQQPTRFWTELHDWLAAGGYPIVAAWAEQFVVTHGAVGPADRAPTSARKQQLIEDSRSREEAAVLAMAGAAKSRADQTGKQIVLVEEDVVFWASEAAGRNVKASLVRKWLRAGGLYVTKKRYKVGGHLTFLAAVLPVPEQEGWPSLQDHRVRPSDLVEAEM
jgi:hypothetical protein